MGTASARHGSNVAKGNELQNAITVMLQGFQTDGHIIQRYRLLNSSHYPDFYVLDAKDREWLLEAKNLGDQYTERTRLAWFKQNVFAKTWNARVYKVSSRVVWNSETGRHERIQDSNKKRNGTPTRSSDF